MSDDNERLRCYAESRDQDAFSAFVPENINLVYSAAFRQTAGDVHLAEDITQRVFTSAAQKASNLSRHPMVRAWLYQSTRYAAIDATRSRRRRQTREEKVGEMTEALSESSGSERPLDWEQVSPELDQFIASLGERDRDAVILRFFDGKSFADVGARLRISEGAARMRVDRALERLRAILEKRGLHSSCAALGALVAEKGLMAAPAGLSAASIAAALNAPAVSSLVTALGILKFMSIAKITATGAAVVALLSIAAAVHEYQRAQSAEAALTEAASAKKALPESARTEERPTPRAETKTVPDNVPSPPAAKPPVGGNSALTPLLMMLSNPAMQQQTLMQAKIRLDGQYGDLFKKLSLTPDQLAQFKNLLIEKQMVGFDSMIAAHEQGIDPTTDPKGFFIAVSSAQKTVDGQIVSLLGQGSYGEFQKYEASVPAHNTVNFLQQSLSYTSTPLTEEQSTHVTQLLSQYGNPALPPGNPFAVLNGDLGIIKLSDQGLALIQGVLSPPQVQLLQEKMDQQLQLLKTREKMGK